MKNYRIRSEKKQPLINSVTGKEIDMTFYHVERRFLRFWWIREYFPSVFTTYDEAVNYVKNIRQGKLILDI